MSFSADYNFFLSKKKFTSTISADYNFFLLKKKFTSNVIKCTIHNGWFSNNSDVPTIAHTVGKILLKNDFENEL